MSDPASAEAPFATYESSAVFMSTLMTKLSAANAAHANLPSGDDRDYYNSFREFPRAVKKESKQLLQLIQGISNKLLPQPIDVWRCIDHQERCDVVVDAVDTLLEMVGTSLDEMKGESERKRLMHKRMREADASLRRIGGVLRPQIKFDPPPDNSAHPFRVVRRTALGKPFTFGEPGVHYMQKELTDWEPLPEHLGARPEQLYMPLDQTPLHWIDTVDKLQTVIERMKKLPEIAIDLEAHSYRTFQGFTCLMQLSSRSEDFLIDTLELRDSMFLLQPVLADPTIIKVMHGAASDIQWLQRDFGLYIVNLFDTHQAAKVLQFPAGSLSWLLNHFCDVKADKQYQTADWRVRPLPQEMVKYAREDTHYLLYVFDRVSAMLRQQVGTGGENQLLKVYDMSRHVCLRTYEKEPFNEASVQRLLAKNQQPLLPHQLAVLRAVLAWRDSTARTEDESTAYVLPTAMAFIIARDTPSTVSKLFTCCNPVPHLLRRDSKQLLKIIRDAVEAPPPTNVPTRFPAPTPSADVDEDRPDSPEACDAYSPSAGGTPQQAGTDTNTNAQSPVLGTEQLYALAGWVERPEDNTQSPMAVPGVPVSPAPHPADVSGISSAPSTTAALGFSPLSFGSTVRSELPSEADRAQWTPKREASGMDLDSSAMYQSMVTSTPPPARKPASTTTASLDVSKLFAQNTSPQAPARIGSNFFTNTPSPEDTSSRRFSSSPLGQAQEATNTPPATPPTVKTTPPEERVPRSLTEIYSLSKQNKKRNKDKKKLKEDSVTDPSPAFAASAAAEDEDVGGGDDDDDAAEVDRCDPVEFMQNIGWIKDGDEAKAIVAEYQAQQQQPQEKPAPTQQPAQQPQQQTQQQQGGHQRHQKHQQKQMMHHMQQQQQHQQQHQHDMLQAQQQLLQQQLMAQQMAAAQAQLMAANPQGLVPGAPWLPPGMQLRAPQPMQGMGVPMGTDRPTNVPRGPAPQGLGRQGTGQAQQQQGFVPYDYSQAQAPFRMPKGRK